VLLALPERLFGFLAFDNDPDEGKQAYRYKNVPGNSHQDKYCRGNLGVTGEENKMREGKQDVSNAKIQGCRFPDSGISPEAYGNYRKTQDEVYEYREIESFKEGHFEDTHPVAEIPAVLIRIPEYTK
jgi:hypothetical protein